MIPDPAKIVDIAINVVTIVASALVVYNRVTNRLSLLEQKFDIIMANGFVKKEVAAETERRLDTRIDDLKAVILKSG
jgi:hypothetical protein